MKLHHILTYINFAIWLSIVAVLLILWLSDALPVEFVTSQICDKKGENCEKNLDAIRIAMQLGRLDFVSIFIGVLGLSLGVGAIFGFMFIRERAEVVATQKAEEVSKEFTADYLRKNLPGMADAALMGLVAGIPNETADKTAEQSGDDGGKG